MFNKQLAYYIKNEGCFMFKTSELASLLGVDRSFLHYYDKAGIILPYKNENQYRQYSETDLIALASAKYYRAMEMNLNSVRSIIHSSGYEEKFWKWIQYKMN